jgi:hypothetical protein
MKTIQVAGANLFQLALQEYGDATMWLLIASANGLTDPMVSGLVTLNIPSADPAASGGIGQQ